MKVCFWDIPKSKLGLQTNQIKPTLVNKQPVNNQDKKWKPRTGTEVL